jgi:hypothetical protein
MNMYQVKEIEGRKLNNGYEIQVIGKGEKGPCRVADANGNQKFSGTYDECVAWLRDRGLAH